jgi:hypothetical protein
MDLAEKIKGFYRLLDLIGEPGKSGSNGCGEPFDMHRSYPELNLCFCSGQNHHRSRFSQTIHERHLPWDLR